jgi:hypothetical protein
MLAGKGGEMIGSLRKQVAVIVVAAIVAAVTAMVMSAGSAMATHVGTVYYRRGANVTVPANSAAFAQVKCPNVATRVVGGGFFASGFDTYLNSEWPAANSSQVDQEGTRFWAMYFANPGADNESVTPYAICVHGGANFGGAAAKSTFGPGAKVAKKS